MPENRLNIIQVSSDRAESSANSSRAIRIREMKAKFERLWLIDPEQFNPLRNCMQRERLERTWRLLTKHTDLRGKLTVDIGCAAGVFSRRLRDAGAQVEGADIAENALKHFQEAGAQGISLKQEAMPITHLPDQTYDLIICTELIADLPQDDYRLFFAELARLIKADGYLVCSSDIDIDTFGGVERLVELAQTEFDLLEEVPSYHALYLRLKRFFEMPSRFIASWQNSDNRHKELVSRRGLKRGWFWLNTSPPLIWLWLLCDPATRPIRRNLKNNDKILLRLERICHFIWDKDGISHYLFIAKRRPLFSVNPNDIPIEKPKRKQVWD